jgi:hypothetical protein
MRRTPRAAVARCRGQDRDAMTPVTVSSHPAPAGKPNFRRRIAIASAPPKAPAAPPMMPKASRQRLARRQNLDRDRRSADTHRGQSSPYPRRRPDKSP